MKIIESNEMPLAKLQPNPKSLRGVDRNNPEYQQFCQSVKNKGVITPITIRPIPPAEQSGGKEYWVIDGLQRYSASIDTGKATIPVRILDMSDSEVRDAQIIANAHRVETKPKEFGEALQGILNDNPMLTKDELANRFDKSTSWLDRYLGLGRIKNEELSDLVNEGKITLNNAVLLSKLPPEEQEAFKQGAMTQDSGTFGAAVQGHLTELRKARREGRAAGPAQFVPTSVLRVKSEIEAAAANTDNITNFLRENNVKVTQDTVLAAVTALNWTLNMDEARKAVRKTEYDAEVKARELKKAQDKEAKEAADALKASDARKALETQLASA